nr:MAG TPA: hypothetical protein [Caudoviricetes sp.]
MRTREQIKASRIRYNVKNKEALKYARIYQISVSDARKKLAEEQNAVSGKTF